jgi:hypothetical protein
MEGGGSRGSEEAEEVRKRRREVMLKPGLLHREEPGGLNIWIMYLYK